MIEGLRFDAADVVAAPAVPAPIYVIDDEAGVRMALVDAIESRGYRAWSFASGVDLLNALDAIEPGCLLLDICMPEMDGLTVMSNLRARGCDWPLIVMTANGDIPTAVAAMKLGAIEFIEKPLAWDKVDATLQRGLAQLEAAKIGRRESETARAMLAKLTPKESAVLHELMTGQQNKGVAYRLGLSVRTVEMHRANLLRKLNMRTLQEAAALYAQWHGHLPGAAG